MMACCRSRFGNRPVLVPIAVPHFYFDDLLLEADAFAGTPGAPSLERSAGRATVKICDGGELAWATLSADPGQLAQGRELLESALSEFGLSQDHQLSEHWIMPPARDGVATLSNVAQSLAGMGLASDPGAVIEGADPDALLLGELTFVKPCSGSIEFTSNEMAGVRVIRRQAGRFAWFSARSTDADLAIVPQTSQVMIALAEALAAVGMDFSAVVKSTSHYAGGSSEEELFDNMTIRNSYYDKPGPASTGLPVSRFADDNSRIVVDFLTVRALPGNGRSDMETG